MSNAGAVRPGRKFLLDEERYLVLDLNAFCLLEQKVEQLTGDRNIFTAIDWSKPNLRDFTLIIWAALQTNYPELSLEEVRRILPFKLIPTLQPVINALMEDSMPPTEPVPEGMEVVEEEKKTETLPPTG